MESYYLGVDIGGTKTLLGLVDSKGNILDKQSFDSCFLESEGAEKLLGQLIKSWVSSRELAIRGVGVGVPGLIVDNIIVGSPNTPGLEGVNLQLELSNALAVPVCTDNDVNLVALGECWVGSAKGLRNVVFLAIGTGVGGGIVIDGNVYTGSGGAGEIGHMIMEVDGPQCICGRRGCLEAISSGKGIEQQYLHRTGISASAKEIFRMANQADEDAKVVTEKAIHYLGLAAANISNALAPDAIILGGGVTSGLGRDFVSKIAGVARTSIRPSIWEREKIISASLGNEAGLLGAAKICIDYTMGRLK